MWVVANDSLQGPAVELGDSRTGLTVGGLWIGTEGYWENSV